MIAAIILGAGESTRMGTLKQLLPWGNRTVIEASVDAACRAPEVDRVVVVLGHEADRIKAVLEETHRPKLGITVNPDYKLGMFTSVKAGIRSLDEKVRAFFIAPADQPEVRSKDYSDILQVFQSREEHVDIVIPAYEGRGGHPTLFRASLSEEILDMPYDGNGLRDVIEKHRDRVIRVKMDYPGIVHDLDTKEDYRQALTRRNKA